MKQISYEDGILIVGGKPEGSMPEKKDWRKHVMRHVDMMAEKLTDAIMNMPLGNDASIQVSDKKQHMIYIKFWDNLYSTNRTARSFLNYRVVCNDNGDVESDESEDTIIRSAVREVSDFLLSEGHLYKKACSIINGIPVPRTGYDRIPEVGILLKKINHNACAISIGADGFSLKKQYIDSGCMDSLLFYPPDGSDGVVIRYSKSEGASIYGGKFKDQCSFLLSDSYKDLIRQYIKCFENYGLDIDINFRSYKYRDRTIVLPTAYDFYKLYPSDMEHGISTWMDKLDREIDGAEESDKKEKKWKKAAIKRMEKDPVCHAIYQFVNKNRYGGIRATVYTIYCELAGVRSKNFEQMLHIDGFGSFQTISRAKVKKLVMDMRRAGLLYERTMYAESGPHPMDAFEITETVKDGIKYMYCYIYLPTEEGEKVFESDGKPEL